MPANAFVPCPNAPVTKLRLQNPNCFFINFRRLVGLFVCFLLKLCVERPPEILTSSPRPDQTGLCFFRGGC